MGMSPMEDFLAYKVAVMLWKVYPPVVVLLGTFGNIMNIVIMSKLTSEDSTVNIFFLAIAVGDLLMLLNGMMTSTWLEMAFQFHYILRSPVLHYVLRWWLAPAAATFSQLMLVSVTLQRALSVVWPHLVNRICTKKKVRCLIGGVALFSACYYSHYLYCLYSYAPQESPGDDSGRSL
ncbi:hypothetical protein ACOMHN_005069 [Nucella lapillus]